MPKAAHPLPSSTSALREANARRVLVALRVAQRTGSGLSQAQLARETDLAPATVSGIVRWLAGAGLLEVEQGSGRRGALVRIGRGAGLVGGVNIGHSHVAIALGDLSGRKLSYRRARLAADHPASEGLDAAVELLAQSLDELGESHDKVRRIGLGLPAPLAHGVVQSPGILPGWIGLDAAEVAARALGVPVDADNDANLAALAELRRGEGGRDGSLVFLKISSGLGAGIVLQGELQRGISGMAGELGHVTVDENGPFCRCGNRGCLEAYVSVPHVLESLADPLPGVPFTEVVAQARRGNPAAIRALEDVGQHLGRTLSIVVNVLEPGTIVVGGEMSLAGELVLAPLRATLRRHCLGPVAAETAVIATKLGEDASVIGALEMALDHLDLVEGLEPAAAVAAD